jgi:hypothetical protein
MLSYSCKEGLKFMDGMQAEIIYRNLIVVVVEVVKVVECYTPVSFPTTA